MSDYIDHIIKLKRHLRCNMGDLEPVYEDDIIVDGQRHEYEASIDGKNEPASYIATLLPNGPTLIFSYGLRNENDQRINVLY
jgi:hypothetical protein